MSKKHFIQLADSIKEQFANLNAVPWTFDGERLAAVAAVEDTMHSIANVCAASSSKFNRERWLSYIKGECTANGGRVKGVNHV